jgi:hypothetical protein
MMDLQVLPFLITTPGSVSLAATYTLPSIGNGVSFSPSGDYIAVAHDVTPYFTLLNHTTPGSVSLAATYTLLLNGKATAFSPSGDYIAVGYIAFSPPKFAPSTTPLRDQLV